MEAPALKRSAYQRAIDAGKLRPLIDAKFRYGHRRGDLSYGRHDFRFLGRADLIVREALVATKSAMGQSCPWETRPITEVLLRNPLVEQNVSKWGLAAQLLRQRRTRSGATTPFLVLRPRPPPRGGCHQPA